MSKQDPHEYDLLFPITAETLTAWSLQYSQCPETWFSDIKRFQCARAGYAFCNQSITEWLVRLPMHVPDTVYQIEQSEQAGCSFVTVANVRFEIASVYTNEVRQRIA
jgi:hypothetical protein